MDVKEKHVLQYLSLLYVFCVEQNVTCEKNLEWCSQGQNKTSKFNHDTLKMLTNKTSVYVCGLSSQRKDKTLTSMTRESKSL